MTGGGTKSGRSALAAGGDAPAFAVGAQRPGPQGWWPGRCEISRRSAVTNPVVAAVPHVAGRVVATVPHVADRVVATVPDMADRVVATVPDVARRVVAAVPHVADRVIGTMPGRSARGACTQHHGQRRAHSHCLHPEALVPRHRLAFP